MKDVPLEEMGDIAPALEILLRMHAEYARQEPGVSRAMRDVARAALVAEIRRYIATVQLEAMSGVYRSMSMKP